MEFKLVNCESGFAGYRRLEHRQSIGGRSGRSIFEWRNSSRNENDCLQVELLPSFPGQDQMSVMDGIKGAAVYSNPLSQCRIVSRTQYNRYGARAARNRASLSRQEATILEAETPRSISERIDELP